MAAQELGEFIQLARGLLKATIRIEPNAPSTTNMPSAVCMVRCSCR